MLVLCESVWVRTMVEKTVTVDPLTTAVTVRTWPALQLAVTVRGTRIRLTVCWMVWRMATCWLVIIERPADSGEHYLRLAMCW